jgi:hypothetical protein
VRDCETSLNFYRITRRNIPEDNTVHSHDHDNLRSHYSKLRRALCNTGFILSRFSGLHGSHYLLKSVLYLQVALSSLSTWSCASPCTMSPEQFTTITQLSQRWLWKNVKVIGRFGVTYRPHHQSWGVSQERKQNKALFVNHEYEGGTLLLNRYDLRVNKSDETVLPTDLYRSKTQTLFFRRNIINYNWKNVFWKRFITSELRSYAQFKN